MVRSSLLGLVSSFALLALACGSDTKSGTDSPTENGAGGLNPAGTSSKTSGTRAAGGASSNAGSAAIGGATPLGSNATTGGNLALGGSVALGGSAAGGDALTQGGASTAGGSEATSRTAASGGSVALGGSAAEGGNTPTQGGTSTLGGSEATNSTAASGGSVALGGSAAGGDTLTMGGSTALGGSAAEGGSAAGGDTLTMGGNTALGGSAAEGGSTTGVGTSSIGGSSTTGGVTATGGDTSTGGQSSNTTPSGTWYGYRERILGFATVRITSRFAEGDCSIALDGLDDSSDYPLINYKGTCVPQVDGWSFTLQELTVDMGGGPSTLTPADADYAELRGKLWGDSDAKEIKVTATGDDSALVDFSVNQVSLLIAARRSPDDSKYATQRGTYPEINYLGLNAHGNPRSPWLTLETTQLAYVGDLTSVTVTVRGPAGARYEDIVLPYDSDRQQYHANYNLTNYPSEGLWFIAEAKVSTEKGSLAVLRRDTPYANFEQSIRTSSGHDVSGALDSVAYHWLAQDYAPPISATQWLFVEAYLNGSSGERTDPAFYAYRQSSLTEWFAANDDGGSSLMPKLKLPVASGDRIYIEVQDIYSDGGAYSVFASLSDAQHSTTVAPTEDSFEPDNDAASARSLPLDEFQHHLFQAIGESDWLVVEIP